MGNCFSTDGTIKPNKNDDDDENKLASSKRTAK